MPAPRNVTAFAGHRFLARGPIADVALAVKAAEAEGRSVLVFADEEGRIADLDLRGSDAEIAARYAAPEGEFPPARGRGRPRLGVVAREVTLLPRHWAWLSRQRGGASHALRRLIDEARKAERKRGPGIDADRAYRFLSAMAGDLPGFEEASRALFAGDADAFAERMAGWPADVRAYALELTVPREEDHSPNG